MGPFLAWIFIFVLQYSIWPLGQTGSLDHSINVKFITFCLSEFLKENVLLIFLLLVVSKHTICPWTWHHQMTIARLSCVDRNQWTSYSQNKCGVFFQITFCMNDRRLDFILASTVCHDNFLPVIPARLCTVLYLFIKIYSTVICLDKHLTHWAKHWLSSSSGMLMCIWPLI